ncbi:Hsp33 family molecular chaperone HslO [Bdellovibrionota bacterium FG-2]
MGNSSDPQFQDKCIRCLSVGGNLMATAIRAPNLVQEAARRHKLAPIESQLLGEALMGGILLASGCKTEDRVSLSVKAPGFFKQAVVDALPTGKVRGFLTTREATGFTREPEIAPWHEGTLSVVRMRLDQKEPYVGTVPAITGHLAKDLTFYLTQSEQIPSAVGLATVLDPQSGLVKTAGAFLIQVLAGASHKDISTVENNLHELHSLASELIEDQDPIHLLGKLFSDLTFVLLEERPLHYECTCSRERILSAIALLGKMELEDMIEKDNGAEVGCDFCGNQFQITATELKGLIGRTP